MSEYAALRALAVAHQRVAAARQELSEAEGVLQECLQAHAKARPLTQAEHDAVYGQPNGLAAAVLSRSVVAIGRDVSYQDVLQARAS